MRRSQSSFRSDDPKDDDVKEEKEKLLETDLSEESNNRFAVAVKVRKPHSSWFYVCLFDVHDDDDGGSSGGGCSGGSVE
jgi:hypothetical protein